jgi:heparosan-N-sulfate-glucuronate 5-epimerase
MRHAVRGALVEARRGYDSLVGGGVEFAHQPLGRHIDPTGLAGYYCDFRHKARDTSRYADGLPHDSRGRRADWPIPVAQAALGYWELGLEGHSVNDQFLRLADWLVDNSVPAAGGLGFPANVPVPKYGLASGWLSAMSQSEAISVLLRAHALSGSAHYERSARAALAPLVRPVAEGGVTRELDGLLVLEEYPTATVSAVLNGWIIGLFGVHELATATGDERAVDIFDRSVSALLTLLPRYDVGWWSLYSLYDHRWPDLAKPFYQRLHPVLLDALALLRSDRRLTEMARRWESQITPFALARISANKVLFRLGREFDEGSR